MVDGKVQNLPTSFDSALEFVDKVNKKYEPTSVHTTGHSKGAAEAQYVAAERNFIQQHLLHRIFIAYLVIKQKTGR